VSLYSDLQKAKTEEDVKGAYIKALGLKNYFQGLNDIDIQTKEIWFEAKNGSDTVHKMFTQLIAYVRVAQQEGRYIPPFLAVIDQGKAALMETVHAMPVIKAKGIKWSKVPSQPTKESIEAVAPSIETHFVLYDIKTNEKEFIQAVKAAISEGQGDRIKCPLVQIVKSRYMTSSPVRIHVPPPFHPSPLLCFA
jgi:hypothetical protein